MVVIVLSSFFVNFLFLFHVLLSPQDDEDERVLPDTRNNQWTSAEVRVPTECVGLVIGRQGANVKLIQERTGTKINFSDEGLSD